MMSVHPPLWWIVATALLLSWLCWMLRPRSSKGT